MNRRMKGMVGGRAMVETTPRKSTNAFLSQSEPNSDLISQAEGRI